MESTATPRQLSLGRPRALGMHRKDTIHPTGGTVRTLLRRHEDLCSWVTVCPLFGSACCRQLLPTLAPQTRQIRARNSRG